MSSWKGFMAMTPRGPRITLAQKKAVRLAVGHAMVFHSGLPQDARLEVLAAIDRGLDGWPLDRSCATCSYEDAGHCRHWSHQEIPPATFAVGCEVWQDSGAPF